MHAWCTVCTMQKMALRNVTRGAREDLEKKLGTYELRCCCRRNPNADFSSSNVVT